MSFIQRQIFGGDFGRGILALPCSVFRGEKGEAEFSREITDSTHHPSNSSRPCQHTNLREYSERMLSPSKNVSFWKQFLQIFPLSEKSVIGSLRLFSLFTITFNLCAWSVTVQPPELEFAWTVSEACGQFGFWTVLSSVVRRYC